VGEDDRVVPTLRRAVAIGGTNRELVALQHDDMLEKPGERPGCRQTTHAGADHDGLLAHHSVHHPLSYCCPATIFRDVLVTLFGRLRAV
jgi:hypothetical protein